MSFTKKAIVFGIFIKSFQFLGNFCGILKRCNEGIDAEELCG